MQISKDLELFTKNLLIRLKYDERHKFNLYDWSKSWSKDPNKSIFESQSQNFRESGADEYKFEIIDQKYSLIIRPKLTKLKIENIGCIFWDGIFDSTNNVHFVSDSLEIVSEQDLERYLQYIEDNFLRIKLLTS